VLGHELNQIDPPNGCLRRIVTNVIPLPSPDSIEQWCTHPAKLVMEFTVTQVASRSIPRVHPLSHHDCSTIYPARL